MRAKLTKKAYVFDWDDCLVKTDAKIKVYREGRLTKKLTPEEYNFFKKGPEEDLDFSEFDDPRFIINARPYKMWPALVNINSAIKGGRSSSDVYILTARTGKVKGPIHSFLLKNGIFIPEERIITIGDRTEFPEAIASEKRKALKDLSDIYQSIIFFDDSHHNIELAKGIPGVKTRLIDSLEEEVGAPFATLSNTPGMGSAAPAVQASSSASVFHSPLSTGSGDLWSPPKRKRKKRKKKVEEDNINPYDPIATSMAKKMGVRTPFKKVKDPKNQNSMRRR